MQSRMETQEKTFLHSECDTHAQLLEVMKLSRQETRTKKDCLLDTKGNSDILSLPMADPNCK